MQLIIFQGTISDSSTSRIHSEKREIQYILIQILLSNQMRRLKLSMRFYVNLMIELHYLTIKSKIVITNTKLATETTTMPPKKQTNIIEN